MSPRPAPKITWAVNKSGVTIGTVGDLELFRIGKPREPFDEPTDVRLFVLFPSSRTTPDGVRCSPDGAGHTATQRAQNAAEEELRDFYRRLEKGMNP